jgi:hypothetical protein
MFPFFAIAKIVTQVPPDVRRAAGKDGKSKSKLNKAKGKRSALDLFPDKIGAAF